MSNGFEKPEQKSVENEFDINGVESCDQLMRSVVEMFADVRRIREKLEYDYKDSKDRRTTEIKGNFPFQMAMGAFRKHYEEAVEKYKRGESLSEDEKEDLLGIYNNLVHLHGLVIKDGINKGLDIVENGQESMVETEPVKTEKSESTTGGISRSGMEQQEDEWKTNNGFNHPPEDWQERKIKDRHLKRVQNQAERSDDTGYDSVMPKTPEAASDTNEQSGEGLEELRSEISSFSGEIREQLSELIKLTTPGQLNSIPGYNELLRRLQKIDFLTSKHNEDSLDIKRRLFDGEQDKINSLFSRLKSDLEEKNQKFKDQFGEMADIRSEMAYLDEDSEPTEPSKTGWWNKRNTGSEKLNEIKEDESTSKESDEDGTPDFDKMLDLVRSGDFDMEKLSPEERVSLSRFLDELHDRMPELRIKESENSKNYEEARKSLREGKLTYDINGAIKKLVNTYDTHFAEEKEPDSDDEAMEIEKTTEEVKDLLSRKEAMKEMVERDDFVKAARENLSGLLAIADRYNEKLARVQLDPGTLSDRSSDINDLAASAETFLSAYESDDDPSTGRGRRVFLKIYQSLGEEVDQFVEETNRTLGEEEVIAIDLQEELQKEFPPKEKIEEPVVAEEVGVEKDGFQFENKFTIREKIRADYKNWLSAKREYEAAEQKVYENNGRVRRFFGLKPKGFEDSLAEARQKYTEARAKYCENLNRSLPKYFLPEDTDVHQLEGWAKKTRAKLFYKFVQRPVNERLSIQQEKALEGKGKQWVENFKDFQKNHKILVLAGAATVFGTTAVITGGASLFTLSGSAAVGGGVGAGFGTRLGSSWAFTKFLVSKRERALRDTIARGERTFNSGSIDKLESDILSGHASVEKAKKIRAYGSRIAGITAAAAAGYGMRSAWETGSIVDQPETVANSGSELAPRGGRLGGISDDQTPVPERWSSEVNGPEGPKVQTPRSEPGTLSGEEAPVLQKYEHPPLNDPRDDEFNLENDATGSDHIQRLIEKHHGPTQELTGGQEQYHASPDLQEVSDRGSTLEGFDLNEAEPLIEEPYYVPAPDETAESIIQGKSGAGPLPTTTLIQERYHQAYLNLVAERCQMIIDRFPALSDQLGFTKDPVARQDYLEFLTNEVARRLGLKVPDTTEYLGMTELEKSFIEERVDQWFAVHGKGRLLIPEPRIDISPEPLTDGLDSPQPEVRTEQEWEPEDGSQPGAGEGLADPELSTQEQARSDRFFMETVKDLNESPQYLAKTGDSFYEIGAGETAAGYPPTTDWLHNNAPEMIKELVEDAIRTANQDKLLLENLGFGSTADKLEVGSSINLRLLERLLNEVALAKGLDVPNTSEMVPIPEAMADRIEQLVKAMDFGNKMPSVPRYIPGPDLPPSGIDKKGIYI